MCIFLCFRDLDKIYPYFPSEHDLIHCILNTENIHQGNLSFLARFSLDWQRLTIGESLLPELVEFYLWLHKSFAYQNQITHDMASSVAIKDILDETQLNKFMRLKEKFNQYLDQIGGTIDAVPCAEMHHGNTILEISENTSLIHFLSGNYE